MKKNKVLGIDPGLDRTGWAVLEKNSSADFVLQACGLIHTPADYPLAQRLAVIYEEIQKVAKEFKPDCAAIEEMYFFKHSVSVSQTIQTRGVILLALHQSNLNISAYQPKRVKAAICGSGTADKKQMQRMTQLILKLKEPLNPDDVADAAAIAVCHLKTAPILDKIDLQKQFLEKVKKAKEEIGRKTKK